MSNFCVYFFYNCSNYFLLEMHCWFLGNLRPLTKALNWPKVRQVVVIKGFFTNGYVLCCCFWNTVKISFYPIFDWFHFHWQFCFCCATFYEVVCGPDKRIQSIVYKYFTIILLILPFKQCISAWFDWCCLKAEVPN